jgi:uncharacterized protein (DUF885 family)
MDRRQFLASGGVAAAFAFAFRPDFALAQAAAGTVAPGDAALSALLQRQFVGLIHRFPELSTGLGLDKGADAALKSKLDDYSKAGQRTAVAETKQWLAELRRTDKATLSPAGKLNFEVVEYLYNDTVVAGERYDFGGGGSCYTLSQLSGAYANVPDFLDSQHVIETAADAEAYLARLEGFATAIDQDTESQRADAARGVFGPDFVLDLTLGQMRQLREKSAGESDLVASIVRRTAEKHLAGNWSIRAARIVTAKVYPALDRQIAYVQELRGRAVHDAGCWRLPDGDNYYTLALQQATTTTLTPEEVHQMGVEQVASITAQIDTILKSQGMSHGTVAERLTALNADPRQLYPNTDPGRAALIASLNAQVRAMEAKLPEAFATLPQAKLEIKRVPPTIQDGAPNGYYNGAALDGSRPAIYYINLKDTADWPKYGLPTLTFHEGVPGHHLQISLAQEAKDIPMIRKLSPFGAYVEGWALYAEQLADELGFYAGDPFGRAGFLQSYLFRAARLVVDTGIHYKRWSREQATSYMVGATGYAVPRTQREIDRYCVWPGQACSYKVGHLSWVRTRDRAKQIMGDRFDIKQFHQILLESALPLTILERVAEERAHAAMQA